MLHSVCAYGLKRLLAYVVLYFAGILFGRDIVYAKRYQEFCERLVPAKHVGGYFHAAVGKRYQPVGIHRYVAVLPEPFCGICDAGLCYAKILGNVYGADIAMLLLH